MIGHSEWRLRSMILGTCVALTSFAVIGTLTALWPNRLFVRMTPAGDWEIAMLAIQSALLGLYVFVRRPACSTKAAGLGGVINFVGVACPVCNKILLFLFGADALMTYFEPVRLYVAAAGIAVTLLAVAYEIYRNTPKQGGVANGASASLA